MSMLLYVIVVFEIWANLNYLSLGIFPALHAYILEIFCPQAMGFRILDGNESLED